MGTNVIGNPDSQVWKILGIDVEEDDDKNTDDEDEESKPTI
jgi:hypothetical protein